MQHRDSSNKARPMGRGRAARLGVCSVLVGAGIAGPSGCLDRPVCAEDCQPRTTNIFVDTITQTSVDKIDLLFMIDNSISMADKQKVLADAVPDLVNRLVNPVCVNPQTGARMSQPLTSTEDCPAGQQREFNAIDDIHIGVVTSSLGGYGSSTCTLAGASGGPQKNDHAHLIGELRPGGAAGQNLEVEGFLNWSPKTKNGQTADTFGASFTAMIQQAGELGCGYEATFESVYRFLADPEPPADIALAPCQRGSGDCATPTGIDQTILAQRRAFMRADSLLSIIIVSDENDCSIRASDQFYLIAEDGQLFRPPKGSTACATNPNDTCCYNCQLGAPMGCAADPACDADGNGRGDGVDPAEDDPNLRCWQQKRRFGLDFLYPTNRYLNMLTKLSLCTSRADLDPDECGSGGTVPNPIFTDQQGSGKPPRSTNLVFLAGIIGVPWQDIQATVQADGVTPVPASDLRFLSVEEMNTARTWDTILGDPKASPPILPSDPHMIESRDPRSSGAASTTGTTAPPTSGYKADPVNGHEWFPANGADLQYACIFDLKPGDERNCANLCDPANPQPGCITDVQGCDCDPDTEALVNPLCQAPDGTYGTVQRLAKAYPGVRELQLLKDFGTNSIVASICARNLTNDQAQDYGYRPAVDAIVERLKDALTGKCLPRVLQKDETGRIPCTVIEANTENPCPSRQPGRTPNVPEKVKEVTYAFLEERGLCGEGTPVANCSNYKLCAIEEAGADCHQTDSKDSAGWCYVDPATQPDDDPALVAQCKATEQRIMRFVPQGEIPSQNSLVLIACFGAPLEEGASVPMAPAQPTPMPTMTAPPAPAGDAGP